MAGSLDLSEYTVQANQPQQGAMPHPAGPTPGASAGVFNDAQAVPPGSMPGQGPMPTSTPPGTGIPAGYVPQNHGAEMGMGQAPQTMAAPDVNAVKIAQLESIVRRQAAESQIANATAEDAQFRAQYQLTDEMTAEYDESQIGMIRSIINDHMVGDVGMGLLRHHLGQMLPSLLAQMNIGPAGDSNSGGDASLDAMFMSQLGYTRDQVRNLPGYNAYMGQRAADGRQVHENITGFLNTGDMQAVIDWLKPFTDPQRASQAPGPLPHNMGAPGSVAAPQQWQGGQPQPTAVDPSQAIFSQQKLAPLLEKAQRHGGDSLTEEEKGIVEAAMTARYENRVV